MRWIGTGMHSFGAENRKLSKLWARTSHTLRFMSASFAFETHQQSLQLCPISLQLNCAVTYFVVVYESVVLLSLLLQTEGFFPSDRPGNPRWHCSLVLLFYFFFLLRTMKGELCSPLSPMAFPILHPTHTYTHPVQTWALPQSLFPPPLLRFLHLSPYSMTVCLPYPTPSALFSTHTQTPSCAPEQTVAYIWPQLSLHLFSLRHKHPPPHPPP